MQSTLFLSTALAVSYGTIIFWKWDSVIETHAIQLLNNSIIASFCF